MPLHRRLPKRGFSNIFKKDFAIINIRDLAKFEKGSIVDETALIQSRLIRGRRDGIKLLGQGEIEHPLTLKVNKASKAAIGKVTRVGGKVEVLPL
jgi:large subunit ribosomal protein L15